MRAAIALAGFFLISSSVFAADSRPNMGTAKMNPKVVVAREAARAAAAETPMAEGSLEKFGASGLPQ